MEFLDKERQKQVEAYIAEEDKKLYRILQDSVKNYTQQSQPRMFSLDEIDGRHVPKLIELLNSNPNIISLYLGYSSITNDEIKMLAEQLQYVTKLHLDCVNLGRAVTTSTTDAVIALAESNIRELKILRTTMTNEDADTLIQHSKQARLNIRDNRHVNDEHVKRAEQKAKENSTKELNFFGSSAKRHKQATNDEKEPHIITPPNTSHE